MSPAPGLPKPMYTPDPGDPAWLGQAVQFHGHLGPWAVAGLRMGMAGRQAVAAEGYFDVAVRAEGPFVKPPQSCFLDGLQVSTGATMGKKNLEYKMSESLAVDVKNTRNNKAVRVRPTARLIELLSSFAPVSKADASTDTDHESSHADHTKRLESLARTIARLPQSEIMTLVVPEK